MPEEYTGRATQPASSQPSRVIADLLLLAPHTEIVHHIPGRIRLRLKRSGLEVISRVDVEALMRSIPGIRNLRVNPVVGSLTVGYDENKLPYSLWERLGSLRTRPELKDQVEKLLNDLWE